MTCKGHVKNGVVVLDEPGIFPEGAEVRVSLVNTADSAPMLYERLEPVIGMVGDLPADASSNVDHYLYGHPKLGTLPEGAEVRIELVGEIAEEAILDEKQETLGQQLLKYAGQAVDLPSDAAENLDHYLYGAPKK